MTDTFDFVAQDEGSGEPIFVGSGDGSDIIRGGAGADYGDDGSVSPMDVLIVINDLGDGGGKGDLFLSGEAERGDGEFAALADDATRDGTDHIDPVLIVIQNDDFWGE